MWSLLQSGSSFSKLDIWRSLLGGAGRLGKVKQFCILDAGANSEIQQQIQPYLERIALLLWKVKNTRWENVSLTMELEIIGLETKKGLNKKLLVFSTLFQPISIYSYIPQRFLKQFSLKF
jgi:hypothetical protein